MDDLYPLQTRLLPDGRAVLEERGKAKACLDAIRAYDPRCSLVRNLTDETWEIWRVNEDGSQARVGSSDAEFLPEPLELVHGLWERDTWKGYDPVAAIDAHDAVMAKATDDYLTELGEESGDRMHYAFVDEFSAHMPAARPISTGPTTGNKRVPVEP